MRPVRDSLGRRRCCRSSGAFLIVFAIAIFLGLPALAHAQTPAGSVTALVGSASLQRAGDTISVTVGLAVQVADQVVVAQASKVTITLIDGSLLEAASSSTIVIDEALFAASGERVSTKVRLLGGLLRSVAKHTAGGKLPNFEVHTPNAILAARGTTFDTQYSAGNHRFGYGSTTQFTDEKTLKGTVGARNATQPVSEEVSVPAGYETTIAGTSAPTSPGPSRLTGIPWQGLGALTATEPQPGMVAPPPAGVDAPPPPAPPPPPPPPPPSLL